MSGRDDGVNDTADILYLPRWRPGGHRIGAHRGREAGGLGTFRDQVSFARLPDARRIDLRASLRDPFEGVFVRRFEARSPVETYALVDLSASMRFRGRADRLGLAGAFCTALARSATRIGDGFGVLACDRTLREDLSLPATRHRAAAQAAAARIGEAACEGRGAEGFVEATRRLAGRPKLIFLVSDFRWPEPLIEAVFSALALHDVTPVLLADSAEDEGLPSWGLVELDDLEGAGRRLVFLRPSLRRRWIAREAERAERLRRICTPFARPPFRLADRFDAEALSRHLMTT
ncbi:MxaS protein [Methylorubrum podarium]|uniref:MxaS protein n=1 Tax=Methylorubrum podarium TaxID=200476 RepID=A0ABV1QHE7_9HYPH